MKALDRINVKRMLAHIKKECSSAAAEFVCDSGPEAQERLYIKCCEMAKECEKHNTTVRFKIKRGKGGGVAGTATVRTPMPKMVTIRTPKDG